MPISNIVEKYVSGGSAGHGGCRIGIGLCWYVLSAHAGAQSGMPPAPNAANAAPQVVVVDAIRKADEIPYRRFFRGMQVFEENHYLAPSAALRFRLYPRSRDASFDGLVVKLVGGTTDEPVLLDENQSFSLPRDGALAGADAMVGTNKKEGTYAWRVDIRTPGLPPHTRRLGDLRLECKVDMKGAQLRRMVRGPDIAALAAASDPCTYRTFANPFFADRPVFNVTLVSGNRRESISGEWMYANSTRFMPEAMYELADWRYTRDRQYRPPIADASWPDDTLIEFDDMDDPVERRRR